MIPVMNQMNPLSPEVEIDQNTTITREYILVNAAGSDTDSTNSMTLYQHVQV